MTPNPTPSQSLWPALVMELFERWAYYGMVLVLGIYVVENLGLDPLRWGTLYGVFTSVLYFLPLLTGALADRFGYKRALIVAFSLLAAGYACLAQATAFPGLFGALMLIAVGGSIVKPTITGTVTRATEAGPRRAMAFGLFIQMVNAGSLIGPIVAAQIRNRAEFTFVFWVSAAACLLMVVQAVFLYRDPVSDEQRKSAKPLGKVFGEIILVLGNWRFVLLLVIFSGFCGMFNLLFGFMPLYVAQFSDLQSMESTVNSVVDLGHWLNPEVLIGLDALWIIMFQSLISYLTRRWRIISALAAGSAVATVSWVVPALSTSAWVLLLGIFIWSLGEMTCAARFFEYCGSVAPPDQVAMYMGYSFLAFFLGNAYSGPWGGWLYQTLITDRMTAGLPPQPALMFAGFASLGILTTGGFILYGRFIIRRKD